MWSISSISGARVFNASQTYMQQGRALAEQRDYVGAYNAFRQAYGYDPVNRAGRF